MVCETAAILHEMANHAVQLAFPDRGACPDAAPRMYSEFRGGENRKKQASILSVDTIESSSPSPGSSFRQSESQPVSCFGLA